MKLKTTSIPNLSIFALLGTCLHQLWNVIFRKDKMFAIVKLIQNPLTSNAYCIGLPTLVDEESYVVTCQMKKEIGHRQKKKQMFC